MFSIGGVMALKMHNFFEGVDWFAVENMEITPPILLSSEAGTNTPSGKSTGNLTTDPHGAEGTDEYYLATNFDKEFTGQAISISVIEDTLYSGQTSPMRSRANSDPKEDEFKDFEFTSTSFECTEDQLQEFDRYLQVKVQKAKKKKLLKAKKEEKQAIEEAEKKAKEDEEKQKKLAEVEEKKKKQLADEEKKKQEAEKLRLKRERDARNAEIKAHNAIVEKYLSKLEECQKKLKNLRRKARKIEEVEEKIKSNKDTDPNYVITKEQADRIARLGVLMDEISELEEEETDILQQNPGELLDLITGDSSRNVSKNEGKGSLTEHRKESKVLALSAPPVLTPAPQTNSSTDKVQKNSDDNWLAVSNSKKQNKKKK